MITITVTKSYDNRLEAFNSRSVKLRRFRSQYHGSECAEFYLQSPYTPSWHGHIKRRNHTLQLIRKLVAWFPCYVCVKDWISGADCTVHKPTKTKRMACSDVHDVTWEIKNCPPIKNPGSYYKLHLLRCLALRWLVNEFTLWEWTEIDPSRPIYSVH